MLMAPEFTLTWEPVGAEKEFVSVNNAYLVPLVAASTIAACATVPQLAVAIGKSMFAVLEILFCDVLIVIAISWRAYLPEDFSDVEEL